MLALIPFVLIAAWAVPAIAEPVSDLPRGKIIRITTDKAAPYARLAILASRSMHVLDLARQVETGTLSDAELNAVTIAPEDEAWEILVPKTPRENYGLLVWVSPTADSSIKENWHDVLNKHGIIVVSALRSGNNLPSLTRRMPLALTGLHYASTHFPIDAGRVYAGGFSGGSKIAQRLIFAYPDIFRGAILNAGFLEPGQPEMALPDEVLYHQLARRPFVFVTGRRDHRAIPPMRAARNAFHEYCLQEPLMVQRPQKAHQLIQADELAEALNHFENGAANAQATCVDELIAEARETIVRHDREKTGTSIEPPLLEELDIRFGGLIRRELLEHRNARAE